MADIQGLESPGKGCFNGECNAEGCSAQGARYWNRVTHAYYCADCARRIDITAIHSTCDPVHFDWPLHPDEVDRHEQERERPFAKAHPDRIVREDI